MSRIRVNKQSSDPFIDAVKRAEDKGYYRGYAKGAEDSSRISCIEINKLQKEVEDLKAGTNTLTDTIIVQDDIIEKNGKSHGVEIVCLQDRLVLLEAQLAQAHHELTKFRQATNSTAGSTSRRRRKSSVKSKKGFMIWADRRLY
ncbi:MAG: hypothetical protein BMS9Abin11_1578 [Gammaproteobacteria bacterium]|nr:MAG: hypothetical protein BMS9Abin11_1578 [Gammaproteobacteria bacterium]